MGKRLVDRHLVSPQEVEKVVRQALVAPHLDAARLRAVAQDYGATTACLQTSS